MRKYNVSINGKPVGTYRARSAFMASLKVAWRFAAAQDDKVVATRA